MNVFDRFKSVTIAQRLAAERDKEEAAYHRGQAAEEIARHEYGATEMKLPLDPEHKTRAAERGEQLATPCDLRAAARLIFAASAEQNQYLFMNTADPAWQAVMGETHELLTHAAAENLVRYDVPPGVLNSNNVEVRAALGLLGIQ
jgi:hypothetical protein